MGKTPGPPKPRLGLSRSQKAALKKERKNLKAVHEEIWSFIFPFSQLVFTIRDFLGSVLSIPEQHFDAITGAYDFATLCNVSKSVFTKEYPSKAEQYKKIFNGCLELNNDRVRVAHGTWFDDLEGESARHVARGSFEPKFFFEKQGELKDKAVKADRLMSELVDIFIK